MSEYYIKEIFSKRITEILELSKIQKNILATKIGITKSAVSQYSNGLSLPTVDTLEKIAKYLGVSTDYLLGLTDEPPCPLFDTPEGILPYWISLSRGEPGIHGSFRYVYGIYPQENRRFLYLDEQPGGTFIKSIKNSMSQSNFLSLSSLLNWELRFHYNPFDRGNIDILFVHKDENDNIETMSDGSRFNGLGIEKYGGARVYSISPAYHDFLDQYLAKTSAEKIAFLRAIRMGETSADAE